MQNTVSGVSRSKDEVVQKMLSAKQDFLEAMKSLRSTKDLAKDLKKENNKIRKQIKKEEQQANSFKHNQMEKKLPFFPSLFQKDQFEVQTSININDNYLDAGRKCKLLYPDKVTETNKWKV